MKRVRVQSILVWRGAIMATLVLASLPARASVVVGERDLSVFHDVGPSLEALVLDSDFSRSCSASCSLLVIDVPVDADPGAEPLPHQIERLLSGSPVGMLPSPSSLSQVGGAGVNGAAVAGAVESVPQDSLRATLSPESRTILPAGPVFRWFRPPRVAS